MKLIKHFFLIALLTVSGATAVEFHFGSDDGLDEIASLAANIPHEHANTIRADEGAGFSIIDGLEINGVKVGYAALKKTLYNYTRPNRRRSLLDSDLFSFPRYYYFDKGFAITPFFMQTWKAHLHGNKTSINQYLNLTFDDIIELIDQLQMTTVDVAEVLKLFHNTKIQERRLGFMFQFFNHYKGWDITWMFPFLYQEHNFYLTRSELKAIENTLGVDQDIQFAQDHLISDKLGFGDLRINLEKIIYETDRHQCSYGFDITLPTAWTLVKGAFGNYFDKKTANPDFDIHEDFLLTIGNEELSKKNAERVGLGILDRLSSILIEHPLGNNRHVGFGIFFKDRFNFRPDWYLYSKIKAEIFTPCSERRFFRERYSDNDVDAIQAAYTFGITDAAARIQLDAINTILRKQMLPQSYKTMVFPGAFFQGTFHFVREFENWNVRFGTDLWYHTKEHLSDIETTQTILNNLDIEKGRMGHAFQQNLFLGFDKHHKEGAYFDWSFYTNYTAFSYGIGKTFTLGIKISHEF